MILMHLMLPLPVPTRLPRGNRRLAGRPTAIPVRWPAAVGGGPLGPARQARHRCAPSRGVFRGVMPCSVCPCCPSALEPARSLCLLLILVGSGGHRPATRSRSRTAIRAVGVLAVDRVPSCDRSRPGV